MSGFAGTSNGFNWPDGFGAAGAYMGKALGNFSSSNTVASAAGQTQLYGPGKTLWFIFQSLGTVNATTETVISCSNGSLAAGKGWLLTRAGTASGAAAKKFFVLAMPNHFVQLDAPPDYGISVCCLIWKSNNDFALYMNGALINTYSGFTLTAPDSSCVSRIGSPDAGTGAVALTSGRVLAYALWATEATGAQAIANTFTTGDRFKLPTAVTGDASCTVNFNAMRDWDGSASTITTLGSSPVTYAVAGSPTRYTVAERRVPMSAGFFWDGHRGALQSAFSRVKVTTDALSMAVESYSSVYSTNTSIAEIGLYVNGTYTARYAASQQTTPQMQILQLGAGTGKACFVWEGGQTLSGSGPTRLGTYVSAVRLPLYLADGTTAANSSIVAPSAVQKRLVHIGDSIMMGVSATPLVQNSQTALLRADFPTSGTGGVTCLSCGTESIYDLIANVGADAVANAIIAECNGTTNNWVWIALQTNDYGFVQDSAATFETQATAFLTALYAAASAAGTPGFVVWWQTAIQRIAPASEAANSNGSTLPDFRTKVSSNLAAAFPAMNVVNGAAGAIVSNANMAADGIHILAAGAVQMKASVKTNVGY